jgi:hypothetical protein
MNDISLNKKADLVLEWFDAGLDELPNGSFISRFNVNEETILREVTRSYPRIK